MLRYIIYNIFILIVIEKISEIYKINITTKTTKKNHNSKLYLCLSIIMFFNVLFFFNLKSY